MDRWKNKVAVVTGASAGCGAAVAKRLVENGLSVVGLARNKEKMEAMAKMLQGKPGQLYAIRTDIKKEEDIKEAFKWVQENLGPVHILINSAGIVKPTNLVDGDSQLWKDIFETNVHGLCVATREALISMKGNEEGGQIVHVNSLLGHQVLPVPTFNVYPASKFAVTALAETLRHELQALRSNIKVSCVSPGAIDTEFLEDSSTNNEAFRKYVQGNSKLSEEDVADAIIYILSTPSNVQIFDVKMRAMNF